LQHEDIKNQVKLIAKSISDEIIKIRRHIHKNPELSFQEKKTSKFICQILKKNNISFTTGVGGYGVVAIVKGLNPQSHVLGIRADMDALPIQEKNSVSYKSLNDGVMHACGHDVHTAIVLGAAIVLKKLSNQFHGSIKFIFQPAEEKLPGGASLMIKEGVLLNPKVDKMLALHVYPEFEVGDVGFRSGKYMAACDELSVIIKGKGGHAALPDKVVNPITAAAKMIISSKENVDKVSKDENYVLEFGDFHASGASNVIPEEAVFQGTLRTLNESFRSKVHEILKSEAEKIEKDYSVKCDFKIIKGYPALYNNPDFTNSCKQISKFYLTENAVKDLGLRMSSEDFSFFSQNCPSCFFRLGVANIKKGITHLVHTPYFDVDESCLEIGAGLISYISIINLRDRKIL
tara:strand:- start:23314 stop:24522 length:1209 start_codon:yes stop_codon:yes gene_type:complete